MGSVFLQWVAPSGNGGHAITGYTLQRSIDGGSTWPTSFSLGTGTSYTDATCGARGCRVPTALPRDSIGTGPNSNTATANGADAPSAPGALRVDVDHARRRYLSLTAADGDGNNVTDYQISTKVDGGSFGASASVGTTTSYEAPCDGSNNTAPDSTCTYVVRAVNSVGTGPNSNQASVAPWSTTSRRRS